MISTTRKLSVALAATLLIAACGSDADTGDGADTTVTEATTDDATDETTPDTTAATDETTPETTATAETTPDTTEAPAEEIDADADAAAAAAALLTLADLPDGWSEGAAPNDARSEIDGLIAECLGLEGLTAAETSAATVDFTSPDGGLVVAQTVGVEATVRDARTILALFTTPDVPECVAAAYNSLGAAALSPGAVSDGAQLGEAVASRLAVGAAGDATQAIRVTIPVTGDAATTEITVDLVVARVERSLTALTFEGRVVATAVETIDVITATAASRLPA